MIHARSSFWWFLVALIALLAVKLAATAQTQPNIVFMLSDDQAWDGLSVPMHPELDASYNPKLHTPNTQRLAEQGMRFSAAYAPAPVCAPTRISLMTGRSAAAVKWTKAGPSLRASANPKLLPPQNIRNISSDSTTVAELLQDAGYTTAHFGKWHIDGGGPESHGFDVSDGNIGNEASSKFIDPNPVDLFGMAERAEQFMHQASEAGKPFYVQLSWLALHSPENALKSSVQKYQDANFGSERQIYRAALTHDMDTAVGRVMDAVDRLGLADNTYIIFMSDNGGTGGNNTERRNRKRRSNDTPRLAGGKGSLWEGGVRVPLIVRGPGIQPNTWSQTRVVGYDLYPTFLDWAGQPNLLKTTADPTEGGSLTGILSGRADTVRRPRDEMVFHFPHYQTNDGPHSSIYLDQYKLIRFDETDRVVLFDIEADPLEQNDLAQDKRSTVRKLERKLDAYLNDIDAQRVQPNPDYDPDKPTESSNRKRR
ncbi:MAG: sulfatase [Planctomycetota bacterium]